MEYQIVEATRWLQSPFFDAFFKVVSWFGTEIFFLIVFVGLYWAYKREYALKFGVFYLVSVGVNSILKLAFNRTRPNGGEHSFPSGHSQGFAVQGSMITYEVFKNKAFTKGRRITLLLDIIISWVVIAYARMYLNMHFLTDVLGGLFIAILLVFICEYVYSIIPAKLKTLKVKHIIEYVLFGVCFVAMIVFSVVTPLMEKVVTDDSFLTVYWMFGAVMGVTLGDWLNDLFVKYDPSVDNASARVVKSLLGFGILAIYYYFMIIRFASRLAYLLPPAYLVMMFLATFLLPLVFKKWSNEEKRIDEFDRSSK